MIGTASCVVVGCTGGDLDFVALVSGFQATFGLLLVSLTAPTALAEERARGSLDVLMTTPLSSDRIVLAKWWGAYRVVPALAFLPAIGAIVIGFALPENPTRFTRGAQTPDPVGWIDRVAFVCLPTALLLAQGAVVTSFGLALATWSRRLGRAVAVSVATYAAFSLGWLLLIELGAITGVLSWLGLFKPDDQVGKMFFALLAACACPLGAQIEPVESMNSAAVLERHAYYIGLVIVFLLTVGAGLVFLGLTLATFNRSMGRMSERPQPRAVATAAGPSDTRAARARDRVARACSRRAERVMPAGKRLISRTARAVGPRLP